MSEINERCLETFPGWLQALGDDVQILLRALQSNELGSEARCFLTGGINYLFKTLDLIPDGIDDIGYLDDAFILRMTAQAAMEDDIGPIEPELIGKLGRLAGDTELLSEFLNPDVYERLDKYARDLRRGAARGRQKSQRLQRIRQRGAGFHP